MTDTVASIIRSLSHFNYIFIPLSQRHINQINSLWAETCHDNQCGDSCVCVLWSTALLEDYYANRVGVLSYLLDLKKKKIRVGILSFGLTILL